MTKDKKIQLLEEALLNIKNFDCHDGDIYFRLCKFEQNAKSVAEEALNKIAQR